MSFFKTSVAVIGMGMAIASCQKSDLADQPRDKVAIPEVSEEEFGLTPLNADIPLVGYLVLWRIGVPADGMATVLDAIFTDRAEKVAALQHLRGEAMPARTAVQIAAKNQSDWEQHLRQTYGSSDSLRLSRLEKAHRWFAGRLDQLLSRDEITEADLTTSVEHLQAYCDAKVWELAASGFGDQNWFRRPSPHLFCEAYYEQQGYFEYGEGRASCLPTKDPGGKNYFDCLWREGVIRSQLYGSFYDHACKRSNPTTKREQLQQWIRDGTWRRVLADVELGRQLRSAILGRGRMPFDITRAYPELKDCSSIARLDRDLAPSDNWQQAAPIELRNNVEAAQLAERPYSLLPDTGDLNRDQARWELLSRDIQLVGERANDSPSLTDYWWVPEAGLAEPWPYERAREREALAEFFAGFEQLIPPEDQRRREELAGLVQAAEQRLAVADRSQVEMREAIGAAQDRGARSAALPGVAYGFAKLNGTLIFSQGRPELLVVGEQGGELQFEARDFDPATGVMTFEAGGPRNLFGLEPRPRREGDPYFLDPDFPSFHRLTAKLAWRRVESRMWALTGEVTFAVSGQPDLRFGALTLDNYSAERKSAELP